MIQFLINLNYVLGIQEVRREVALFFVFTIPLVMTAYVILHKASIYVISKIYFNKMKRELEYIGLSDSELQMLLETRKDFNRL